MWEEELGREGECVYVHELTMPAHCSPSLPPGQHSQG